MIESDLSNKQIDHSHSKCLHYLLPISRYLGYSKRDVVYEAFGYILGQWIMDNRLLQQGNTVYDNRTQYITVNTK